MQRISITNPQNIIDGTAKKYYFKLRNTGGPKGDKGDKGDTGATGPQGPQGDPCTVVVNSTATLEPGSSAYVTNTGSLSNAVLNFGIPKGDRGPTGPAGQKGERGPQGEQGPIGPQGTAGQNATVYVGTTITTNPGTQARVYNTGTENNAVLNFEIPRGDLPTISQTTGQATDQVMSQKATTDALNSKQNTISNSNKLSADLVDDTSTTHKFVTTSEKTTWNAKQNALTAGDNITISGNTISATDTTYTAGDNIEITGTTISTPALVPEVVTSLPAEGAEGKLYLTPKAHTTQTASGNPISVNITDNAGKIESLKLDGDTEQQSYTGINLFGSFLELGYYDIGTGEKQPVSGSSLGCRSASASKVSPNTQYIFSVNGTAWTSGIRVFYYASDNTFIDTVSVPTGVFTTPSNCEYINFHSSSLKTDYPELNPLLQIEAGSTASPYQPYTGGQASPNPDYPQAIQTVTGEQTVSINGTDYSIDLGSIELCKLGTYQDYIYKDGENWKVHKATGVKTYTGESSENWSLFISGTNKIWRSTDIPTDRLASAITTDSFKSNSFIYWVNDGTNVSSGVTEGHFGFNGTATNINFKYASLEPNLSDWTTWLSTHNISVYYPIATAADTTITDTTLIAQLEAVRTAALQNGANTISNTATGSNLAGDMEIGYYGYNPTNRYDKWLWLDLNNNYEQIGE